MPTSKKKLTVGLVQQQWYPNADEHKKHLQAGIAEAAEKGARLICLQELTLSPYYCSRAEVKPDEFIEDIETGPSLGFAREMANKYNVFIVISLVERGEVGNCYNTAVTVGPEGIIVGKTRKQHIPSGEGYNETHSFTPGLPSYPLHSVDGCKVATPTCYDQWFPELARIYGQKGAELIVYPTAIGGEPTAPNFDSQPMWELMQRSHAIANNCFIVAVNRIGTESMDKDHHGNNRDLTLYGSSFICGPDGKIITQAPRDKAAVLVATLDFSLRDECRRLFPFFNQRRPKDYVELTKGQNPALIDELYGIEGIRSKL